MKTFVVFIALINAEGNLDFYYKNVFACPDKAEMVETVDNLVDMGARSVNMVCIDPTVMGGDPA